MWSPSHLLQDGFLLDWFSTLKTDVIHSYESSIRILTTWCYIPKDGNNFYSLLKKDPTSYCCSRTLCLQLVPCSNCVTWLNGLVRGTTVSRRRAWWAVSSFDCNISALVGRADPEIPTWFLTETASCAQSIILCASSHNYTLLSVTVILE
jgi:hypothetical protein